MKTVISSDTLPLEAVAGQCLMVGFRGTEPPEGLLVLIAEGLAGGVILFKRNLKEPAQVRRLCQSLQAAASESPGSVPLWISVDQEGGRVARLSDPFTVPPAAAELAHGGEEHEPARPALGHGPVAERQASMEHNAAAMKAVVPMVKGEVPYDAKRAELAMRILATSTHGFIGLFPAGTEGEKSTAAPSVWKERARFEAAVAKFEADAVAAIEAAPKGLDAFRAAFGKAAKNCGACHKAFRVKK